MSLVNHVKRIGPSLEKYAESPPVPLKQTSADPENSVETYGKFPEHPETAAAFLLPLH